ncbi:MAG: 30S ribosomal protein S21 [Chloroflexi bacterium]|nr:30S ribosomal protein S21 [Chloroflexota bacterium]
MVTVKAHDDESFEQLLKRFNRAVSKTYSRPWHKRRYGYYEKPSTLRRKQNRTRAQNRRRHFMHWAQGIRLLIPLETQWRREGPSNAKGR